MCVYKYIARVIDLSLLSLLDFFLRTCQSNENLISTNRCILLTRMARTQWNTSRVKIIPKRRTVKVKRCVRFSLRHLRSSLDERTDVMIMPAVRKPRKSSPQSKLPRPASNNVPLILNLIDSLIEEKQFDHNDENLLGTIDSLIASLKHLKEKLRNIHEEETHPLNLSKPKTKNPTPRLTSTNHSEEKHAATPFPANFPLPSAIFPSQSYFSPYSGKRVPFPSSSLNHWP